MNGKTGRIGGAGGTGSSASTNGQYAGSMGLKKPKKNNPDDIKKALDPALELLIELENENSGKEVGFFVIDDGNMWRSDFFIGVDIGRWLYFNKPIGLYLNNNNLVKGYVHTHPDYDWHRDNSNVMQFSGGDFRSWYSLAVGEFSWFGEERSFNFNFMGVVTPEVTQIISVNKYTYYKAFTTLQGWINGPQNTVVGDFDKYVWGVKNWKQFGFDFKSFWRKK